MKLISPMFSCGHPVCDCLKEGIEPDPQKDHCAKFCGTYPNYVCDVYKGKTNE